MNLINIVIDKIKRRLNLKKLSKVNPTGKKIANIIYTCIDRNFSQQEEEWICKIETLRKELINNNEEMGHYVADENDLIRTDTLTVSEVCQIASKRDIWTLILFKFIREFQPNLCLELGTCLGISAAYQAAAQHINKKGCLITLEGANERVLLARKNLQSLALENVTVISGNFQDSLPKVICDIEQKIDFAFIDGHHDEKATITYFEMLLPHLTDKSLVIFDDINWSKGMHSAWQTIIKNDKIKLSVHLNSIGICVLDSEIKNKCNLNIPF
ncbi:O-methyltransferase [Candidatus Uabimicrobium sp. HlEnr_7]|uniref:O-methyltransferase n=1 Tax=Candidatus Uabimicrobium helgolandensis TaxID=3095367 RepID=UPI003556B2BD